MSRPAPQVAREGSRPRRKDRQEPHEYQRRYTIGVVNVGLLGDVIGAGVTGLLQIRGRRLEQLRERQIDAADQFSQAATEVFVTLTARVEVFGEPGGREQEWLALFARAASEVTTQMHETTRRLPRLELLSA